VRNSVVFGLAIVIVLTIICAVSVVVLLFWDEHAFSGSNSQNTMKDAACLRFTYEGLLQLKWLWSFAQAEME
jgi:hypothetical protein